MRTDRVVYADPLALCFVRRVVLMSGTQADVEKFDGMGREFAAAILKVENSERPGACWVSLVRSGDVLTRVEVLENAPPKEVAEALTIGLENGWGAGPMEVA
jgi:hypothetical protein